MSHVIRSATGAEGALLTLYLIHHGPLCQKTFRETIFFSQCTAKRVDSIVASFFGVSKKWDKRLLKTMFFQEPGSEFFKKKDLFEFTRKDNPHTTWGVVIRSPDHLLLRAPPAISYPPLRQSIKLIAQETVVKENPHKLCYEEVKARNDFFVTSFFNSETFQTASARNSRSSYIMMLTKD